MYKEHPGNPIPAIGVVGLTIKGDGSAGAIDKPGGVMGETLNWEAMDATDWVGTDTVAAGVEHCLKVIAEKDKQINAFEHVFVETARKRAAKLDKLAPKDRGPLHGLPVAIKAENNVLGVPTSFGTHANITPPAVESAVVRRLREAGAVIIGTTRMSECGAWPVTETDRIISRNPINTDFSPGGSSGGSAAAVAAGMVPVAIGGDGGGSIRIPAAVCGLFGLKPQLGRISVAPYPHLWHNLGVVGPLTKSARDLRLLYKVLAGNEPTDQHPATAPMAENTLSVVPKPQLRIGTVMKAPVPGITVHKAHRDAVAKVASLLDGDVVAEVELPKVTGTFIPLYYASIAGEVAYMEHPEDLDSKTKQLVAFGNAVPKTLVSMLKKRSIQHATTVNGLFKRFDLLVTPVIAPRPAPAGFLSGTSAIKAQMKSAPFAAFTALFNVTGHPAISVPVGYASTDGLPIAVQLAAAEHQENLLIDAAEYLHDKLKDKTWG